MRIRSRIVALACVAALSAGCGGGGGAHGPVDLGIDGTVLAASLDIVERLFAGGDCEVLEGEVGGPGLRRLLLFDLAVINFAEGDLVLGNPSAPERPLDPADFAPDPCRARVVLAEALHCELFDSCGAVVATRVAGLLYRDSAPYGTTPSRGFDEAFQGLSAGWACVDEGPSIDITGLPAGTYTLVVTVNGDGKIREAQDLHGNSVSVAVEVDSPPVTGPTPGSIDVTVDRAALLASAEVRERLFDAADCDVMEGAIGGPGLRRLALFDAVVVNYGEEHVVLGDPAAPEPPLLPADFGLSCDGETVFFGWARYELRTPCGGPVVLSRDLGLRLVDSMQILALPSQGFGDGNQGISSGWASVHADQWLDITGVPEGLYDLVVTVNAAGKVAEADDVQPDTVTVPFLVPDPDEPILTPNSVDVTVDRDAIVDSVQIVDRTFDAADCAFIEGAIGGTGVRRLLRFETIVVNLGEDNVVLGDPASPEPPFTTADFIFSPCHGHYHFEGWATYELKDAGGAVVAVGHKQAFCLLDTVPYLPLPRQGYDCDFQGISAGWGDVYTRNLDGQWVDITGVPEGDYDLVVTVNAEGKVVEANDLHTNSATVPVHVPDPSQPPP